MRCVQLENKSFKRKYCSARFHCLPIAINSVDDNRFHPFRSLAFRLSLVPRDTFRDSSSLLIILTFSVHLFALQVSPNDGLPTIVCHMCRAQLDSCQQFRDKAQRSQQKLQNFLQFANKLTGSPQVNK